MNYLAHLALAQPNATSRFGNLLGDFMRGTNACDFADDVQRGLANHRLVDKFTDNHPLIKQARRKFSPARRRFGGIIIDVTFDHFLQRHWQQFYQQSFDAFVAEVYLQLPGQLPHMPVAMQQMVGSMLHHQWLGQYRHLSHVARALDNTAGRIRFTHQFHGSIEEVEQHYPALEATFLEFYPQLQAHVENIALEHPVPGH